MKKLVKSVMRIFGGSALLVLAACVPTPSSEQANPAVQPAPVVDEKISSLRGISDTVLGEPASLEGRDLAAANKAKVWTYIKEQYGQTIISGQQNLTWNQGVNMMTRVHDVTNRYPAIQGFDFLDSVVSVDGKGLYTANSQNQVQLAIDWWNSAAATGKNGLVAFAWHWRDPSRGSNEFYSRADSENMVIPLDSNGNFDHQSPLGMEMKKDIDFIGRQLLTLQKAGVPVLWRPLHEGMGDPVYRSKAWFWWGEDGDQAYVALYRYMYYYYENVLGLKNLIWIWNGQSPDAYPGSDIVDISAWDTYNEQDMNGLQLTRQQILSDVDPDKILALSEVGGIPDSREFKKGFVPWSFFIVWNDSSSRAPYNKNDFWSGESWNPTTLKELVYSSDFVITLDELPQFVAE